MILGLNIILHYYGIHSVHEILLSILLLRVFESNLQGGTPFKIYFEVRIKLIQKTKIKYLLSSCVHVFRVIKHLCRRQYQHLF